MLLTTVFLAATPLLATPQRDSSIRNPRQAHTRRQQMHSMQRDRQPGDPEKLRKQKRQRLRRFTGKPDLYRGIQKNRVTPRLNWSELERLRRRQPLRNSMRKGSGIQQQRRMDSRRNQQRKAIQLRRRLHAEQLTERRTSRIQQLRQRDSNRAPQRNTQQRPWDRPGIETDRSHGGKLSRRGMEDPRSQKPAQRDSAVSRSQRTPANSMERANPTPDQMNGQGDRRLPQQPKLNLPTRPQQRSAEEMQKLREQRKQEMRKRHEERLRRLREMRGGRDTSEQQGEGKSSQNSKEIDSSKSTVWL